MSFQVRYYHHLDNLCAVPTYQVFSEPTIKWPSRILEGKMFLDENSEAIGTGSCPVTSGFVTLSKLLPLSDHVSPLVK